VAAGAQIEFLRPARIGDELAAVARLRTTAGRSGLYDVTVRRGTDVVAEFRGRATRPRTPEPQRRT
jgi:acyl-CoA thioesterase